MKDLKHILIICFFASFALGSCSKVTPLQKVSVTESSENDQFSSKMRTLDDGCISDGEVITDPDHDEDHDKDNMTSAK